MNIVDAFELSLDGPELICLVGGGGKTTTMFALAQALKFLGKRVLVTTTTNIIRPGREECDRVIVDNLSEKNFFGDIPSGTITVLGATAVKVGNETKLTGVDKSFLAQLSQEGLFDCLLVEADGSKRKPIKAPAHYEPIVPDNATRVIGVVGLDALGNPITEEHVHRVELFCQVVKRLPGELLDAEAVVELIVSPQGLFKGVPEGCKRYVLLNKAEDARRRAYGEDILSRLRQRKNVPVSRCVIAAMAQGRIYP